jgi:hypothetical protein
MKAFKSGHTPNLYWKVELHYQGKRHSIGIHLLLAKLFIPNPLGLPKADHIDQNTQNNDLRNIRWSSNALNAHNSRARGTSKYKGVCRSSNGKRWQSAGGSNGVTKYLGTYDTEQDAARAYNVFATATYGADACLNVIPQGDPGSGEE